MIPMDGLVSVPELKRLAVGHYRLALKKKGNTLINDHAQRTEYEESP